MLQNANRSLVVKDNKSKVSCEQCTEIDQFAPEKISVFRRYRSSKLKFSRILSGGFSVIGLLTPSQSSYNTR